MFHYRFMIIVFSCVTSRNSKAHHSCFVLWKLSCANMDMRTWITMRVWLSFPIMKWNNSYAATTQKPHITFVLPPFFFNLSLIFFTFILLFFKSWWTASSNSSFYPLALPNTINTILSYFKLLYLIYCIWSVPDTPKTHMHTHTCRHCGLHQSCFADPKATVVVLL